MADLAYTDTAEPRRPSLRVALSRDGFRALAFAGTAALVAGFAAAGGGYFPIAWGWTARALMWVAALGLARRKFVYHPAGSVIGESSCYEKRPMSSPRPRNLCTA